MEGELRALRGELHPQPPSSVMAATTSPELREKVCALEGELRALRDELQPQPPSSVIAATTAPIKTEPSDVTDTC